MTTATPDLPDRSWVTADELAAARRVSKQTILREIRRGHLKAEKPGRDWIIEKPEAQRWLLEYDPERVPRPAAAADPLDNVMRRMAGLEPRETGGAR